MTRFATLMLTTSLCLGLLAVVTAGTASAQVFVLCPRWNAQDMENNTVNTANKTDAGKFTILQATMEGGLVFVTDGNTKGEPLTTESDETWLWVLTKDRKILTAPEVKRPKGSLVKIPTFSHSSFMLDEVLSAGEWVVNDGRIVSINNDSSHAGECTLDRFWETQGYNDSKRIAGGPFTETGFRQMLVEVCKTGDIDFKLDGVRHYSMIGTYNLEQKPKPKWATLNSNISKDDSFKCTKDLTFDIPIFEANVRGGDSVREATPFQVMIDK